MSDDKQHPIFIDCLLYGTQEEIEKRRRHRITLGQWIDRPSEMADSVAYWWLPISAADGLDPWRVIDGVDPLVNASGADVWLSEGRCMPSVDVNRFIYVSRSVYDQLTGGGYG